MSEPTGIEAEVCKDIASRQAVGIQKYGATVKDNPLPLSEWIEHAYQESLDLPIYLKRAKEEAEKLEDAKKKETPPSHPEDEQIVEAWMRYHGPVEMDGEEFVPMMPPVFNRGFHDGYDAAIRSASYWQREAKRMSERAQKQDAYIVQMMRDCLETEDTVWMPRGNETYFERLTSILKKSGWSCEDLKREFPKYF